MTKKYTQNKSQNNNPPLIRVNQLMPIIELLQSLSLPWEEILTRSKLPTSICDKPNALIPELCLRDVMLQAAEFIEVENIGFYIGQNIARLPPLIFDPTSKTVKDALNSLCELIGLYGSNTDFSLQQEDENGAWFCRVDPLKTPGTMVVFEQYFVAAFIRVIQNLANDNNWSPAKICFSYVGEENLDGFDIADCSITFNQSHTALFIDAQTLALATNKAYLKANPMLAKMDDLDEMDIIQGIEEIFCTYLDTEVINEEFVSNALLSNPRQLQRKLKEQDTSFRKLRSKLLFREAKIMLKTEHLSLNEIAEKLGYSDTPHFIRAFSKWAGYGPGQYRKSQQDKAFEEKGCER